jgi:hypothetical protein
LQALPSESNVWLDTEGTISFRDQFQPDSAPHIETVSGNSQVSISTPYWDNDVSDTTFPDVLDFTTPHSGNYDLGTRLIPANSGNEAQSTYDLITASRRSQEPETSISAPLSCHDPSPMLQRRTFSKPELELTADLALYTLRSYLYVMADQDSIPPFIHPKYGDWMGIGTSRPSPLYAAIKFAKMLYLGRQRNKTLIWSLIRLEQERLLNEVSALVFRYTHRF